MNLKLYIHENEKWILDEETKLVKKIDDWEKLYPDSADYGFDSYDYFEDEIQKISKDFKDTSYSSLLMVAYSYFEVTMKNICIETEKYIDTKIGLEDLKGNNYIEKSKRFLDKVVELDSSDLEEQWNKIKDYQKIRNIIAHNNGRLKDGQVNNVERIIRENGNMRIEDSIQQELKIENSKFILDFCEIADFYIKEIVKKIIDKFD